jgi:hypothetical protein
VIKPQNNTIYAYTYPQIYQTKNDLLNSYLKINCLWVHMGGRLAFAHGTKVC